WKRQPRCPSGQAPHRRYSTLSTTANKWQLSLPHTLAHSLSSRMRMSKTRCLPCTPTTPPQPAGATYSMPASRWPRIQPPGALPGSPNQMRKACGPLSHTKPGLEGTLEPAAFLPRADRVSQNKNSQRSLRPGDLISDDKLQRPGQQAGGVAGGKQEHVVID